MEGPVGGIAVEARDVVARGQGEVLARLVGNEPASRSDRAQEGERESARPGADLQDQVAGSNVAPEEDRSDVLRIDGCCATGQAGNQLRIGRAQQEEGLTA